MILGFQPGILLSLLLISSILIFLTINMVKYNWKNGEFVTRVALHVMMWSFFIHVILVHAGHRHGVFFLTGLIAFLFILLKDYLNKKPSH